MDDEVKEAAKQLYLDGWSQKRIAAMFDISNNTITTWKKEDKWDQAKTAHTVNIIQSRERVWTLIGHQTKELVKKTDDNKQPLSSSDLDALSKLYKIVENKPAEWLTYIKLADELLQFLQHLDLDLAKALAEHLPKFIEHKRTK